MGAGAHNFSLKRNGRDLILWVFTRLPESDFLLIAFRVVADMP
jgi:hypothetical protein